MIPEQLRSIHGVDVYSFVSYVVALLEDTSTQRQGSGYDQAEKFFQDMQKAGLTDRGRHDVYIAALIGLAPCYQHLVETRKKYRKVDNKLLLLAPSIAMVETENFTIDFENGNPFHTKPSLFGARRRFGNSATAYVLSDFYEVYESIASPGGITPLISTSSLAGEVKDEDYLALFRAIVASLAFLGKLAGK